VGDELDRWAAERAPHVVARAEAEAVAALREALLASATGEHVPRPATAEPQPASPAATGDAGQGDLLWAYCVLRPGEAQPPWEPGVHEAAPVERVEAAGLAALVSRVPRSEFGAEPLRRNLNDIGWLERVARAHEAVLEDALESGTAVPLRMCTIYESDDSVRRMLEREHDALADALELLSGREEWGVKVLVDPERLTREARARSDEAERLERELGDRSGGGAYMLRRRLERHVREVADSLASEVADQVHARIQDWAIDAVTLPPQNRELSGHEGEMLLNAAYLVEADRVAGLADVVRELESRHEDLGARIELTGPWPPYNFVPGGEALA
jgi:hypothetical protein